MSHTILLVDDEPNLLVALQRALRKNPYEIATAQSGAEALRFLKDVEVDVVVSDQNMPGMSGAEFLRRVHESYPDTVRFMLTGNATLEVALEAINKGAISRFFTKPCNDVELSVAIRQALEHKDLMAEAWRLLKKVQEQDSILDRLERESPGITEVKRDSEGVVIMEEDVPANYERFMNEM